MTIEALVTNFLSSPEFRYRHAWLLTPKAVSPVAHAVDDLHVYTWANDQTVGWPLVTHGQYELDVTAAIRSELAPGMTFVDVGASFGYFSVLARQLVGSTGRVVAIEPGADNCSLLLLNAAANDFDDVELWNVAVDRAPGVLAYVPSGTNGQVATFDGRPETLISADLVRAVTLDAILVEAPQVDLMKLDIEGAEYRALLGAHEVLCRHQPTLIFEYLPDLISHVSGVSGSDLLDLLASYGYGFSVLLPDGNHRPGVGSVEIDGMLSRSGKSHLNLLARRTQACS